MRSGREVANQDRMDAEVFYLALCVVGHAAAAAAAALEAEILR